MIKPQVHINVGYKTEYKFYNRYRELIKDLSKLFIEYKVKSLLVIRYRRGEWGEWFEHWEMDHNGKPTIVKSGWS